MELFVNQILAGISTGAIYACMALAVVMIYQAIDHLNFAQGEMAMFSTFVSWQLMLLDEPSFGLAPLIVRDLFKILGKINREDKVTILVVEQNAQLALELADKAYVIETGRIVMSGSADEIANNEDVRKSYLGY